MPDHFHLKTLKRIVGTVISTGMQKTVVVGVPRLKVHPKTRKIMNHITKYFCHDHHEICGLGDKVEIKPCGQVSKKKKFTVIDLLVRHPQLAGESIEMSKLSLPLEEYQSQIKTQN
jgi:small subunit ribosomal protein S17